MKEELNKNKTAYNPNLGFIGDVEVKVSNYLFSNSKLRKAYKHAKPVTDRLMAKDVSGHFKESKKLTKFLKNRDLTFSKKTNKGEYKTFTVPCTTTVVPLQKSLFNEIELASQKLMISLRAVLQDIYSARSLEDSKFINGLPHDVREIFITAIKTSSNYFPQLHHVNMKDYPFLDNVGLDLVLVEDYINNSEDIMSLVRKGNTSQIPTLPFRILELNAGSPSGASNNMNVLQGIHQEAPEILDNLGKMMPNDHFKILGETYKSLGENWTNRKDGIQIILTPGGKNGAAPEIHQLAAYSGLIYTDADQLYQDEKGYIRLRTVSKENPVVTAIYSRINSDSALFDPKKNLIMRDPDSAEPVYLRDELIKDENDKGRLILDSKGKPIPLQSNYAIPGAINAIINRKLYMGGLNRILDNKIILATLTHYAPKYFSNEIKKAGLDTRGPKIMPPQTLPPTMESVKIIERNPEDWVVKVPSLAGGQGVYILKTLSKTKRKEVLNMINEKPTEFAYQQLVKIARIPVATYQKDRGHRFANLAADIRAWVFYGAGENTLPKMSHNALVRYAPHEKGAMSSIVNTSAGGGYAPFVIVDDVDNKDSVTAKELTKVLTPKELTCDLPVFVAAQMVQVSRMLKEANKILSEEKTQLIAFKLLMQELKEQLKEILSFTHPRSIESIYRILDILDAQKSEATIKKEKKNIDGHIAKIVKTLTDNEEFISDDFKDQLLNIRCINAGLVQSKYGEDEYLLDLVLVEELEKETNKVKQLKTKKPQLQIIKSLTAILKLKTVSAYVKDRSKSKIKEELNNFCAIVTDRIKNSEAIAHYASLFKLDADVTKLQYETLYLGKRDDDKEIKVATQYEFRTGKLLTESDFVSKDLKDIRQDWLKVLKQAEGLSPIRKAHFLNEKRKAHFEKHPVLQEYQYLINSTDVEEKDLLKLLDILPYAKFNITKFAEESNISIEEVFSNKLKKSRISLLSTKDLKKLKLCNREYAGECFAKKKKSHGLYSDSEVFIWVRKELDPFTILYTAGHELIHFQQIKNSMAAEKRALKDGGISMAKFLNYYGNFLGDNQRAVDSINFEMIVERKSLYGFAERIEKHETNTITDDLLSILNISDKAWDDKLEKFGSNVGFMMDNKPGTRVRALQEVLPALENAKNIIFAQELGLVVNIDAVQSALPTANYQQIEMNRNIIINAAKKAKKDWEALRVVASHQYHGVNFYRADKQEENLTLKPLLKSVAIGSSYNQTQQ